jgi:hypothetical protein
VDATQGGRPTDEARNQPPGRDVPCKPILFALWREPERSVEHFEHALEHIRGVAAGIEARDEAVVHAPQGADGVVAARPPSSGLARDR